MEDSTLNSRDSYQRQLEALRLRVSDYYANNDMESLRRGMLEAWRLVTLYCYWVYTNTLHCKCIRHLREWNGDGCGGSLTEVVIARIIDRRTSCNVPLIYSRDVLEEKACVPVLMDMYGQTPPKGMSVFDTIDPFPTYLTRGNFLFEFARKAFMGESAPMTGGATFLRHRFRRLTRPQQFGRLVRQHVPFDEDEISKVFADFLFATEHGETLTKNTRNWILSPCRRARIPIEALAIFHGLRKSVEARLHIRVPAP